MGTGMMHAKAALEHLAHAQDLRQLPVRAAQPPQGALAEDMDLALVRGCRQVQVAQVVCQQVHSLLGEAEHHHRQQRPVKRRWR